MIYRVHISGSPSRNCVEFQRYLRGCVALKVSVEYPLCARAPDYSILIDSSSKAPFPTVVTATRGSISHIFSVFGERGAEQAADVILTIFPELARPPRKLVNPALHLEVYAARSRQRRR